MLHLKLMFCGHKLLEQEQPETIDLQKTTQALLWYLLNRNEHKLKDLDELDSEN